MKVSLIIPTYNKVERLKLTLASLINQTYPTDKYEVIVVDDGSFDETSQFLKRYNPSYNFQYINQQNSGRASARNRGLKLAKGELMIFSDDDLILHPKFIEEHVRKQNIEQCVLHGKIVNLTYLKFFQDPENGVLYPNLVTRSDFNEKFKSKFVSQEDIINKFYEVIYPNNKETGFEIAVRDILTKRIQGFQWLGFTGGNVSVLKSWMDQVGGFDESFGYKWGCEDLELGYRLYKKGYNFLYSENAVNYHMAHVRLDFREQIEDTFSYFFKKHPDSNIYKIKDFLMEKVSREIFVKTISEETNRI